MDKLELSEETQQEANAEISVSGVYSSRHSVSISWMPFLFTSISSLDFTRSRCRRTRESPKDKVQGPIEYKVPYLLSSYNSSNTSYFLRHAIFFNLTFVSSSHGSLEISAPHLAQIAHQGEMSGKPPLPAKRSAPGVMLPRPQSDLEISSFRLEARVSCPSPPSFRYSVTTGVQFPTSRLPGAGAASSSRKCEASYVSIGFTMWSHLDSWQMEAQAVANLRYWEITIVESALDLSDG